MASPAPATYSSLRADIRHQEASTDVALGELSALSNGPPTPFDVEVEDRLAKIFRERHDTIAVFARIVENDPATPTTRIHHLTRARELLTEHEREFRRMKSVIQQTRDREALSLSMKRPRSAQQPSDVDRLIEERDRIDHSLGIADSTLEQAYQTRNEFGRQRATLTQINRRLMQSATSIPGINTLIGKINTRKKRDSLIIAALLALCIFGLLMFR